MATLGSVSTTPRQPCQLRVRWLGRVPYDEAVALQRAVFAQTKDYLLLLEHPPTYTLGVRADRANILADVEALGAVLTHTDRGGDVTYHGPGQLVGYPVLTVAGKRGGGMADTVAYIAAVQQVVVGALRDLGLENVGALTDFPGVWVDPEGPHPRKIAAVGIKLTRGRTMHGFALNVTDEPLEWFGRIIPCGLAGKAVTTLHSEGVAATLREVADAIGARATAQWGQPAPAAGDRADVAWKAVHDDLAPFSRGAGPGAGGRALVRLAGAGVDTAQSVELSARKPDWLRVKANMGAPFTELRKTLRSLSLVTVCEEAGCPNIHECWNDGTATFMVLGDRCTRACGFCLVDTRHPTAPLADEPGRVAEAIERMGLAHAVLTMVARDDLDDGGAAHVAACVDAIRARTPSTRIEVLVSDFKGRAASIETVVAARPHVYNHNIETVARLQRAVRPSAGYARSLAALARAHAGGLATKSGIMVGLGETETEVRQTLDDLRAVGVSIVTIGQYLRPTSNHLPVHRWWTPSEFDELRAYGRSLGFAHVEASPLTRSSYHARKGADEALATT